MVAPSAEVPDQEAEEIFWGGLVQLRGRWWPAAGLRQAQALPWPWEMRLAQNGGMRTRVCAGRECKREEEEEEEEENKIDAGATIP
jgi:hypothetical protein